MDLPQVRYFNRVPGKPSEKLTCAVLGRPSA